MHLYIGRLYTMTHVLKSILIWLFLGWLFIQVFNFVVPYSKGDAFRYTQIRAKRVIIRNIGEHITSCLKDEESGREFIMDKERLRLYIERCLCEYVQFSPNSFDVGVFVRETDFLLYTPIGSEKTDSDCYIVMVFKFPKSHLNGNGDLQ